MRAMEKGFTWGTSVEKAIGGGARRWLTELELKISSGRGPGDGSRASVRT